MKLNKLIIIGLLVSFHLNTWASTEGEGSEWMSYDNIISELSSSRESAPTISASGDPFDSILLHAGVGLATSYIFLNPSKGARAYGFLRGFEANLGIDLFSRNWMAEGSFRSFSAEELQKGSEVSLKEFDLKVVYHNSLSRKLGYKMAAGMAARYLDYKYNDKNISEANTYSTPSAVLSTGLKAKISPALSVGTDIGYRWALVNETIDDSAIDASLRLDAHF